MLILSQSNELTCSPSCPWRLCCLCRPCRPCCLCRPWRPSCPCCPCRDLPCRDLPCRDLPCRDLPCRDLPCRDLPCSDLPCSDLPCRDLPCRDLPEERLAGVTEETVIQRLLRVCICTYKAATVQSLYNPFAQSQEITCCRGVASQSHRCSVLGTISSSTYRVVAGLLRVVTVVAVVTVAAVVVVAPPI
jgi:hypothetical protein